VPPSFRLLATMNSWDRGALFRLSFAVQRRFAIVHVGAPDDDAYARLLARHARDGVGAPLDAAALAALRRLFSASGVLAHRPIGPAVAIDMIRYLRRRDAREGLAEAIAMYLLPQIEGLPPDAAIAVWSLLDAELASAPAPSRAELEARFRELFPGLRREVA
jgi:MoxR-like ATPase